MMNAPLYRTSVVAQWGEYAKHQEFNERTLEFLHRQAGVSTA
jgi:hypothetical protein